MRKLKIKPSPKPLLTMTRSHQWSPRMVYILTANKYLPYKYLPLQGCQVKNRWSVKNPLHRHDEERRRQASRLGG
jgi:hypothetical protein